MHAALWVAALLSALIHVLFFCMESLWWTKPAVYRRFRSTEAQALVTKSLAFNQGFYNLFLALGTFAGLGLVLTGYSRIGWMFVSWNCFCMLGAAVVLAGSAPGMRRGAVIQGAAPLLFLALAALRWAT